MVFFLSWLNTDAAITEAKINFMFEVLGSGFQKRKMHINLIFSFFELYDVMAN